MESVHLQNLLVYRSMLMAKRHCALQVSLPVDRLDERIALLDGQIEQQGLRVKGEAE